MINSVNSDKPRSGEIQNATILFTEVSPKIEKWSIIEKMYAYLQKSFGALRSPSHKGFYISVGPFQSQSRKDM
jgi:hypothetical protein